MKEPWKQLLKPFTLQVEVMWAAIQEASAEELEALRDACEKPSQTNCGWSTYEAAKAIRAEVNSEIARRKYAEANANNGRAGE